MAGTFRMASKSTLSDQSSDGAERRFLDRELGRHGSTRMASHLHTEYRQAGQDLGQQR